MFHRLKYLVYAFIVSSEQNKHEMAQALIRQEPLISVSVQVINEVSVNLLRKAAFSETDIRRLVASFYQRYRVISLDQSTLRHASTLRERYQFSFWDGIIVACALAADATTLYSEDMRTGLIVEDQLTIVNPLISGPEPA